MDQENKPRSASITPFTGHPAANFGRVERTGLRHGLQPLTTPLLAELVDTMNAALERCEPHALSAAAKASLRGYVCQPALLHPEHKQGDPEEHRRHLLYAAPDGRFSILAIVWNPDQRTPIHGHTAWGAAGVHEGQPYCESYKLCESSPQVMNLRHNLTLRLQPGDISTVEPGIDDAHRIGNDSRSRCITIHIYGRDLLTHPRSINILLDNL